MSYRTFQRLERLQTLNSNRLWKNRDLYRLMYKEDLYILAYEQIKSKPGNMTPGTDEETLDGFSLEAIREIISEMRTEQFQFKPVKTAFILVRFGYEWFEAFCERHGTKIIVINGDKLSPEKEMVEDLLAIVTVFSARFHGLRSYRKVIKDACLPQDQA